MLALIILQLTAVVFCVQELVKQTVVVCTQFEQIRQRGASFEGGRGDG